MKSTCLSVLALLAVTAIPQTSWAQSAIAGVVSDATGAVIPGVTVEARSPALIEQAKVSVTDDQGQYRIVDLRPGTYAVTFSLTGFSTVLREGITLESNFTAKVDVQMRVGAIEETITVSGAAPVVDVQSSQRREVLVREEMDVLPTGRTYANVARTLPALAVGGIDVGGSLASENIGSITAYGGPGHHMAIDGLSVAPGQGSGTSSVLFLNHGAIQEYVYQVNGGFAETQTGGVQVNMIPRTGGNTLSGWGVAVWANSALQSINASADQLAAGLEAPSELNEVYDYNFSLGGPVLKDRLWFFNSYRWWTYNDKLSLVHDGRMGAVGAQVVDANLDLAFTARLTGQVTPKNKVSVMYEYAPRREHFNNITSQLRRPEATGRAIPKLSYVAQAKWTSTLSPKVLVENLQVAWRWKSENLGPRPDYNFESTLRLRPAVV